LVSARRGKASLGGSKARFAASGSGRGLAGPLAAHNPRPLYEPLPRWGGRERRAPRPRPARL